VSLTPASLGVAFYRGPSLLTGDPIVGLISGLAHGSANTKTGPMAQAWILRTDVPPMDAKRQNTDDAICGDCKLRGRNGRDSGCYVVPWQGPYNVWNAWRQQRYPDVLWPQLRDAMSNRTVRLGAYGDPAAIPFEVWQTVLETAEGWIGYTHAWRHCDPRFKRIVMASVDSENEFISAGLCGWRTFRILRPGDAMVARGEFNCPASDEMGHRTTCRECLLCRGTSSPARSVAIRVHGKPSSQRAFGIRLPVFGRTSTGITEVVR
jgi:hypothetical protein